MQNCSNWLHRYNVTSPSQFNGSAIQRFNVAKSFVVFLLFVAALPSAFAQKRAITEKDLWDFVWIGDPQVSPDGSRVAFVRVTVNDKREGYNTSIWSVNLESGRPRPESGSASQAERREGAPAPSAGEAPRQLTKGDHDSTPRWSPDGK